MTINPDDLLILLEDGPKTVAMLARWLSAPAGHVTRQLRTLAAAGLVKQVGVERHWALASYCEPSGTTPDDAPGGVVVVTPPRRQAASPAPADDIHDDALDESVLDADFDTEDPDAALLDEFLEAPRRRPGRPPSAHRQPRAAARTTVPPGGEPAWWVGKSREQLNAEATARALDMSASKEGRRYQAWRPTT